jgi:hypothetical protein
MHGSQGDQIGRIFVPLGDYLHTVGRLLKITKVAQMFGLLFSTE